jgi:hypothetical protein
MCITFKDLIMMLDSKNFNISDKIDKITICDKSIKIKSHGKEGGSLWIYTAQKSK